MLLTNLKPILFLSKLLGICSAVEIYTEAETFLMSKKTTFVLVAILVRATFCVLSVVKSLQTSNVDVEELAAVVGATLSAIICLYTDEKFFKLIGKINKHSSTATERKLDYAWTAVCLISCVHVSGIYAFISRKKFLDDVNVHEVVSGCVISYHKFSCILIVIQFLVLANEIKRKFSALNANLEELADARYLSEIQIQIIRNEFEYLTRLIKKINESVGLRLIVPILSIPMELLLHFYRIVFQLKWNISVIEMSVLLLYFFGVHCIASMGSDIQRCSYESFQALSAISVCKFSPRIQILIKIFQEHVCARRVEITAAGFFIVNKQLITSRFNEMGTIDLYGSDFGAPSRNVLLTARIVGLKVNEIPIDLEKEEHLTPEYVKINPQHVIPTINDNGFYLGESRAIVTYLVQTYAKDDSLYPKDTKKRAVIDQRLYFDACTLYQRFSEVYYPKLFYKSSDPVSAEKVKKLEDALQTLSTFLSGSEYAAGDELTVADICFVTTVHTIEATGFDLSKYQNVEKWLKKCISELPDYKEVNGNGVEEWRQYCLKFDLKY